MPSPSSLSLTTTSSLSSFLPLLSQEENKNGDPRRNWWGPAAAAAAAARRLGPTTKPASGEDASKLGDRPCGFEKQLSPVAGVGGGGCARNGRAAAALLFVGAPATFPRREGQARPPRLPLALPLRLARFGHRATGLRGSGGGGGDAWEEACEAPRLSRRRRPRLGRRRRGSRSARRRRRRGHRGGGCRGERRQGGCRRES